MRLKSTLQQYFNWGGKSTLKVVRQYQEKYERIATLLAANPELLRLAHRDWAGKLSTSRRGRRAAYSCEEILRALVVMFVEQLPYRAAVSRIDTSEFLRGFVGLGTRPMMDYTFLCKAMVALSARTLEAMNQALAKFAVNQEKISGGKLRMDSTAYETNIHFPTDASLLWDSYRVLARVLKRAQKGLPGLGLAHRYHTRKAKRLYTFLARNGKSTSRSTQRRVKTRYRVLIARVRWVAGIGREVVELLANTGWRAGDTGALILAEATCEELQTYLPTVERIIDQAERRVLLGEQVPNDEKVFSLFEPHTELLMRGKARKPIEFGHKVLLSQSGEKFITHYQVLERNLDDRELLTPALESHRNLFGSLPEVLAADKGFYRSAGQLASLREEIKTVSIAKLGRRTKEETARERSEGFKAGQRFRAGSEGSISVLKRAYKLNRCLFKGFKNFAASVGCAVLCHNLVLLTRL